MVNLNGTLKQLGNGALAQGVVILSESGDLVNKSVVYDQSLVGNNIYGYPDSGRVSITADRGPIGSNTSTLWGGPTDIYVFPTVGQPMEIVSTSSSDDIDGATQDGAKKVLILFLDSLYNPGVVEVEMNGTTPVPLGIPDIFRVNGIYVSQVGTSGSAVGTISVRGISGNPVVTYGSISPGRTQANLGVGTVPDGVWAYISQITCSVLGGGSQTRVGLQATAAINGELVPGMFYDQFYILAESRSTVVNLPVPIALPPKSDIRFYASDGQGGTYANLSICGYYQISQVEPP